MDWRPARLVHFVYKEARRRKFSFSSRVFSLVTSFKLKYLSLVKKMYSLLTWENILSVSELSLAEPGEIRI